MERDQTLIIPTSVMARAVGDELVILDLQTSTYFGLNEVGARAWQLFADGRSFGQVCDELTKEFDVTRVELEADVRRLVGDLASEGLAKPAPPTAADE